VEKKSSRANRKGAFSKNLNPA